MKNKGCLTAAVILVVGLLLLGLPLISSYNGFVAQREDVTGKWMQIDNQLQRRYDLIPNLVETVKGYVRHEEEVFTALADARAKLGQGGTAAEMAQADAELSAALSRLLVVVENYPTLKADTQFLNLQHELAGTENRLAIARKDYNEAVQMYNTRIRRFPGMIIAGLFNFTPFDYYEIDDAARQAPGVNFTD
ncbi:MAG: LemA family protein [bacterium]|jgi:LemA protein